MNLQFLRKKELGIPLWLWGLLVAILLFLVYRHFKNSNSTTASNTASPTSATDQTGSVAYPGSGAGGAITPPTPLDNTQPGIDLSGVQTSLDAIAAGQNSLIDLFSGNPTSQSQTQTTVPGMVPNANGGSSPSPTIESDTPITTPITPVSKNGGSLGPLAVGKSVNINPVDIASNIGDIKKGSSINVNPISIAGTPKTIKVIPSPQVIKERKGGILGSKVV